MGKQTFDRIKKAIAILLVGLFVLSVTAATISAKTEMSNPTKTAVQGKTVAVSKTTVQNKNVTANNTTVQSKNVTANNTTVQSKNATAIKT